MTAPRSERAETWTACALLVAACAGLVAHARYLGVPVVDDAAISLAYGRTFFEGAGLRVTPLSQPVEGFSNPLWTLLLGLAFPLHLDPERYAASLGLLLGTLALPLFALWGPAAEGRRLRLEDALPALVASASPTYAAWVCSGMETGLQALLLALAGAWGLRELRTGQDARAGWALGLLCLTRPEGLLYAGAAGALWLGVRTLQRRAPGRQELRQLLGLLVPVLGWLAVRWGYFADLLPNTYYAKRLWEFGAAAYLSNFRTAHPALTHLALGLLALGLLVPSPVRRRALLTLLLLGAGVLFVYQSKGDWMREWRFLAPLVPLLGCALAAGLSALRPALQGVLPAVGALALLTGAVGAEGLHRSPAVRRSPELPYRYVAQQFEGVRAQAQALGQRHALLGFPDLGGQALLLREAEVVDVAGLADYALAHHAGNLRALDDYLVSEGPPVLLDAHGPSGHLRELRGLMARFERDGSGRYVLRGLSASEDPRCPGGKAATLALAPPAQVQAFAKDVAEDAPEQALGRWRCLRAYLDDAQLPSREGREQLARQAEARAEAHLAAGERLPALRHLSLATLLSDGDAHRRRRTEQLRAELFPRAP
ncbi:hypothetical protein FGE12_04740 [Aggregicoccus sp. 17bor-14]|uniref:hypothetical protein n=1 Tax=Myxococcaceae TaxID=31 RepID=UPI00129CDDEC|nr:MULTISPECIES: hypothetical protein [Myxococcaceae]MBF5041687.1 hypothetical protein [Simulacricoccus sp. 17bor-14]MRI87469.1 hypothetical protein [Aggregicoccus sp. 17bor-14]